MKALCKILFFLLVLPTIAFANDPQIGKYTKQKSIKKAYIVNSDAGVDINNSYGNVTVTTWDEDKIELDILIKVSGDREEWVQKKIDAIDVDINALKTLVSAKTIISNSAGQSSGKSSTIEINYTLKIPKNGGVKISNKYGDIVTADLFAPTNVKCQYGKITMGKLNSNSNLVAIEYCNKSTIEFVKAGTIDADYSNLTLNDFGNIVLKSDYTDVNFTSGAHLKYNSSYGKLNFGKISDLEGVGDYLNIHVNALLNNLAIVTNYSKLTFDNIASTAGNISINSEYTATAIGYDPSYSFDFNVNVKNANLKHSNDLEVSDKQEVNATKSYKGFYRKSGVNKININSEYGNVSLTKN